MKDCQVALRSDHDYETCCSLMQLLHLWPLWPWAACFSDFEKHCNCGVKRLRAQGKPQYRNRTPFEFIPCLTSVLTY